MKITSTYKADLAIYNAVGVLVCIEESILIDVEHGENQDPFDLAHEEAIKKFKEKLGRRGGGLSATVDMHMVDTPK